MGLRRRTEMKISYFYMNLRAALVKTEFFCLKLEFFKKLFWKNLLSCATIAGGKV